MLLNSVNIMSAKLQTELEGYEPSMLLFGSIVLDDFKFGWSDIDFLLLTEHRLTQELAENLVFLRQTLTEQNNGNPYYRLFEGAIISKQAFFESSEDIVVYWGTSGQRLTTKHQIDPFARIELLEKGQLLFGNDFRQLLTFPSREEIVGAVRNHLDIIRKYGDSGVGWLLDIARCLYTLKTNEVIAKTIAGEWAISENLCPDREILKKAVEIRKNPAELLNSEVTRQWLNTLKPQIQRFADVLEMELGKER